MGTTTCLALVQLVDLDALEARVPAALARAVELASAVTELLVDEHGGRVCRSSARGVLACFDEATAALTYTIRLHEQLLEQAWSPTLLVHPSAAEVRHADGTLLHRGLRLRAAVHRGPCLPGVDRMMGPATYHVARLVETTRPGQTLLSQEAWRYLRGALPAGTILRDLGHHGLPGVQGRTRVFQGLPEALDKRTFAPLAEGPDARAHADRLPKIIGRESDLAALHELLMLGVRMINVVGPRGVGRGRLCAQLAHRPPDTLARARVARVKLREAGTQEVVRATADALEIPTAHAPTLDAAIEQLGHAIESMGRALLVFDGLETSSRALSRWLELAPELRIVVHGPAPLRQPRETIYQLRALPPPPPDHARHADAVRLYTEAAGAVDGEFQLTEPMDVGLVVAALGGNPLAIRLAAGVVDRLPPPVLAARFLGQQVSLDDMVALALEQLDAEDQRLLEVCATIPGAFEPDLAAHLLDADSDELVDRLRALVSRNLVNREIGGEFPQITRFSLSATVRRALLADTLPEELWSLRTLQAELVLDRCTYWAYRAFGRNRPEVLARLALDWERLLSIVEWAEELRATESAPVWVDRSVRALLVLEPLLRSRGPLPLELELLDRVLLLCDDVLDNQPELQVRALVARADARLRAGADWQADIERARGIAERWGDEKGAARADLIEGRALATQGRGEQALALLERARQVFEDHDDPLRSALAQGRWGATAMRRGHLEDAEPVLVDAAAKLREIDALHLLARVLGWLGTLYRRTDRTDAARSVTRESIRIHEELGAVAAECRARHELALLDYQLTRYGEAADGLATAIHRARGMGDRRVESRALLLLAVVSLARGDRGAAKAHLLEALALSRERDDSHGEGEVMGYLGIVHHLDEQPEAAREYYRRARRRCRKQRAAGLEALFTAWLGGLEAEQLRHEVAQKHASEAIEVLSDAHDRQVAQAVELLGHVIVLTEGVLEGQAEQGRQALRQQLRGTDPRRLSAEARLAYRRVRRLAARGLLRVTVETANTT